MPDWNSDFIPTDDATLRGEGFDQQQVRIVDINIENTHHKMAPRNPVVFGAFFACQAERTDGLWIISV